MKLNMKDDFQGCLDEIDQMHKLLKTLNHYAQDGKKENIVIIQVVLTQAEAILCNIFILHIYQG